MGLSRKEAYTILELPDGTDVETVRTSYMRLARKYFPDRDSNSEDSLVRFRAISKAYKRLTDDELDSEEEVQMSMADMVSLFHIYSHKMGYHNGYDCSDDDYDDDDDDDDDEDDDMLSDKFRKIRAWDGIEDTDGWTYSKGLTAEQIEKNANELITEEEKEKRKAEKRRAKKKRRREKRRQEKLGENTKPAEDQKSTVNKNSSQQENSTNSSKKSKKDKKKDKGSEEEEEPFDTTAAFFTKVINKKKKVGLSDSSSSSKKSKPAANKTEDDSQELDQVVLRSRQLAIRGNEMANIGQYTAAIDLFTEAIKLDQNDFRFFGNRSYCHDQIQQYDKALRDASKAIELSADWPKGYFRKGRALAGLNQYAEAEHAFMQVLKLDRNCEHANQELFRVRSHQLMEMGFTRSQAEAGLQQYGSVQQALDSLLSGLVADSSIAGEVYMSDEDDDDSPAMPVKSHKPQVYHPAFTQLPINVQSKSSDTKMDPMNPEGLTALWVGNVLPEVTDKKLQQMFAKFGTVTSVRCLPDKFCAFVNYKTKESAGKAMHGLQGVECGGQRLLIKFPDNPITANGQTMIKKPATTNMANNIKQQQNFKPAVVKQSTAPPAAKQVMDDKVSGPVNGDECYFWRTTGCSFGKGCRYKHIPTHKGLDKKPWHL